MENYRKFRSAQLEFPDGVVGIMGSNGSGKTTLIEAISWVLFGTSSVDRDGKEGIKRAGAEPNDDCSATLIFDLGGAQYEVQRTMKGKGLRADAQLMSNGEVLASGERPVTAQIEKILGMDHYSFFHSVFARQKELSALSTLRPAERKKLIIRMLNLDVLQKVIDDIRRDRREEESALKFISDQLLNADGLPRREVLEDEGKNLLEDVAIQREQLNEANGALSRLRREREEAEKRRDEARLKEKKYHQCNARLSEKRAELKGLVVQKEDIEKDVISLQNKLSKLPELKIKNDEYLSLCELKESMEDARKLHDERGRLMNSLEEYRNSIERTERIVTNDLKSKQELRDPQGSLAKIEGNLERLDKEFNDKERAISLAEANIRRLVHETNKLKNNCSQIRSLGPDSTCPTCRRTLGDHYTDLISDLEGQQQETENTISNQNEAIDQMKVELVTLRKRISVLRDRRKKLRDESSEMIKLEERLKQSYEKLRELRERHDSLSKELMTLGDDDFDEEEYVSISERIVGLKNIASSFQSLSTESTRLPQLINQIEELKIKVNICTDEEKNICEKLAAIGYREGELDEIEHAYTSAAENFENGRGKIVQITREIEYIKKLLENNKKAIADLERIEKDIEDRTKNIESLTTLAQVMDDFKQNVMERITPTLSDIASELFDTVTNSKYGGIEVDDNYDIHIYDGNSKYPLSRFSGGEGDLANLCLRLAVSRVLTDRSGNDLNFLVLDEIFGSQDQVRKRAIMETLNGLEKRFHQIILISHIDDTKDMMNNVVTVKELEDGTSELVV